MAEMLVAMISIILMWTLLASIFAGIGSITRRLFGLSLDGVDDILTSFWMGWALTIFFLQIWHLWFPIEWRAFSISAFLGAAGCLWNLKDLSTILKRNILRHWGMGLLFLLFSVWLANRAMAPLGDADAKYHLSAIRWAQSYAIVPGLGNLYGNLAYNSSFFLYTAMLDIGPWAGKSHHLANSLLFISFFAQTFVSFQKIIAHWGAGKVNFYHHFLALLFVPAFAFPQRGTISSTNSDLSAFLLGIILSAHLILFISDRGANRRESTYHLFSIFVISATGFLIKLSFAAMGGSAFLIAFIIWALRNRGSRVYFRKTLALLLATFMISILPWMVRGVILSGYTFYPSTLISFPVEWRVSERAANNDAALIRAWARSPGPNALDSLGNWDWLRPWFRRNSHAFTLPLAITSSMLLAVLLVRRPGKSDSLSWLFLLPSVVGVVFWFATAPLPRYAGAVFWILAAGSVALALEGLDWPARLHLIVLVHAVIMAQNIISFGVNITPIKPGPAGGFYEIPSVSVKTFTTSSGLVLYVPVNRGEIGDVPLPFTPLPDSRLRLRHEGDLSYGFVKE